MRNKSIIGIIVFYIIALVLRYLTNKTEILSQLDNNFLKIIVQAIGPAIGALVAVKFFNLKFPMDFKGSFNKLLIPFLIFIILPVLLISTKTYFTKGSFPYATVLAILLYGLLEEIGWRGFLQQQLKSLPKIFNILIVALLWFIWHLNFDISISNFVFFGILVLGSWGIGWVADKTNSLLVVAAIHSLNNFYSDWNTLNIIIVATLVSIWVLTIIYLTEKTETLADTK